MGQTTTKAGSTFEVLRTIIVKQRNVAEDCVTPDAHLVTDLNCDSLDLVEIIMAAEEDFEIGEIPESELEVVETVQQALDLVERKLKEKQGDSS